jgi:hypothetical protein
VAASGLLHKRGARKAELLEHARNGESYMVRMMFMINYDNVHVSKARIAMLVKE